MAVGATYHKEPSQAPFKQDTNCLRCKKRQNNKLITPKQMVNKLLAQKYICAGYGSKKSVF